MKIEEIALERLSIKLNDASNANQELFNHGCEYLEQTLEDDSPKLKEYKVLMYQQAKIIGKALREVRISAKALQDHYKE